MTVVYASGKNRCKQVHLHENHTPIILHNITEELQKETVSEEPVSPECRLAICLYRLGRDDYIYTTAEMVDLGQSTVATIINEVNKGIQKKPA